MVEVMTEANMVKLAFPLFANVCVVARLGGNDCSIFDNGRGTWKKLKKIRHFSISN
jgi:hypothetical protein